ncbi:MAG: hypothetical protein U0U70_01825 [Chitinophagaceae bacterium]
MKDRITSLRFFVFVFLVILFSSCYNKLKTQLIYESKCLDSAYEKVTLNKLFDSPISYNLKLIEIEGYYSCGYEKSSLSTKRHINNTSRSLWLSSEGADSLKNLTSGFYLVGSQDTFNNICNRKLIVRGVFDAHSHGHLGKYFGAIKNICYIECK